MKTISFFFSFFLISVPLFAAGLKSSVPADGASNVALNSKIVLTFSGSVSAGEGRCLLRTSDRSESEVLTPKIVGNYAMMETSILDYATEYVFEAEAGAFAGIPEKISFRFTTLSPELRLFDAVVAADGSGDYQKVQEAINAAPNQRTKPWLIFIKNGVYEELVRIPSNKTYIHLVGEDVEKTIIQYKIHCGSDQYAASNIEGSGGDGSVLVCKGDHFYAENISFVNTWGHEEHSGPQALVFKTYCDYTCVNNCRLYSFQDTWQTTSNDAGRTYAKNTLIEGAVDFIYCSGDAYFDSCLIQLERVSSVITAPSHGSGVKWGYIFMNCTIDASDYVKRTVGKATKMTFGRPWHNSPKVSFCNTRLTKYVELDPKGWIDHMGGLPAIFADYNTMDHQGNPVDRSQRIDRYYKNNEDGSKTYATAQNTLTAEEVAQYTVANVMSGWRPDKMVRALDKPVLKVASGNMLQWDKIERACRYLILKDGRVVDFTLSNRYDASSAPSATWQVRASGEYGTLSPLSNALVPAALASNRQPTLQWTRYEDTLIIKGMVQKTEIAVYSLSGDLLISRESESDIQLDLPDNQRFILRISSGTDCVEELI